LLVAQVGDGGTGSCHQDSNPPSGPPISTHEGTHTQTGTCQRKKSGTCLTLCPGDGASGFPLLILTFQNTENDDSSDGRSIRPVLVLTMPTSPGLPLSYEHRTLRAHEAYKAAGPSLSLKNTSWLRGQSIMRGTLSSPRGTFDVVAKLGTTTNTIDALRKELTYYQKLRHLQGDCIPKCFGYFFSPSEDQTFGCLVLEYCGRPIRSIYDSQSDIPFALRCALSFPILQRNRR